MGNGFIATGCDLEHSRLTLAVLLSRGLLGVGPAMRERSLVKSAGWGDFCAAPSVSRPAVEVWRCRASGVGQCPLSLSKKTNVACGLQRTISPEPTLAPSTNQALL